VLSLRQCRDPSRRSFFAAARRRNETNGREGVAIA
jgi:hypothetical protein